jgi:hypothetical protein
MGWAPHRPGSRAAWTAWPIAARASLAASSAVIIAWALHQPRTADLAAQVYRAGLFHRVGWVLWDNGWFGGHTVPGYSLLTPWLMASLGIGVTGVSAAAVTTLTFAAIARRLRPRWAWPTAWVAWAAVGDLLIGRVTYAIGLALGLLTVLALLRGRRIVVASLLAVTCAAASPVAGAFLTLTLAIWWTVQRDRTILAACACGGAVTVGCALVFGDGGSQPYSAGAAAIAVSIALALRLGLARDAILARRALLAYMLVATACWLLPTPMGSNVARLGVAFALPVALLARRRVPSAYLAVVASAAAVWLMFAPVTEVAKSLAAPDTHAAFFRPLLAELGKRVTTPARIEVVPSSTRWEAVYVGAHYPLARGWETQLDRARNALFYRPRLSAPRYVRWLHANAVSFVALSRAPRERWGIREEVLLRRGVPGLRLAWASRDWRLYRVEGAQPLASGARVLRMGADRVLLRAAGPTTAVLRVRWSRYWTGGSGVCITRRPDGYMNVATRRAGTVTVRVSALAPISAEPARGCVVP